MTQAIVSAVVNKLADLLVDEFYSLAGADRKLDEVKVQLGQMQCFLIDADSKKMRGDERIKGWVCDVRNVTYETEDAIDKYLVEANYLRLGRLIPNGLLARLSLGGVINFRTSPSYEKIHTMYLTGMDKDTICTIAEMPKNLIKLTMARFVLSEDPMPKLEKLCSLKYLELDQISIKADTIVCTDGAFPRLQIMRLHFIWEIKEWKVENGACPVLKYLVINSCDDLSALPDLQCVNTLEELEIDDPELHSKIKNVSGEEWHKVKHIPTITLN